MYTFGAYQKCGFFFKHLTKKVNIKVTTEVKKEMFTLKKKQKLLITVTMALALVFIASLPYSYASSPSATTTESSRTRMLIATGIGVEKADSQIVITRASFALALEATEANKTIIKFNVISGRVEINEIEYTITGGKGAVIRDKHGFLLQAQGTSLDGQSATLKLAGRYFWMWGRLYLARLVGSLQTESIKIPLLLRSVIRV
jgi:hypothetical protein